MSLVLFLLYVIFTLVVLYRSIDLGIWEITSCIYLVIATFFTGFPIFLSLPIWVGIASIIAIRRVSAIRLFISEYVYKYVIKVTPKLSKTEEIALNIGDSWFEKNIFQGELNFADLSLADTKLSDEEISFLNNETNKLCAMLDEWTIANDYDMPSAVWEYIKNQGFFGLVIPDEFGGKGFSARAHSEIVMKIASRSSVGAVTVMVPNSLGPGELLLHYGTKEQKNYYLPRLSKGIEIPCFALTEPEAGSDATAIKSVAVVVSKEISGKKELYLNISIEKRWITLAPVATLIGLAINLKDPDNLLKNKGSEGITCVLIARDTNNLEIGNRHIPAHMALMNGTIRGENILVPISNIIGGQKNAGHGWEMLVKCLSIGRSISLPALSAAASGVSYLTTGAFARIRQQFNLEIGQFDGVKEKLAEIAGLNYLANATRLFTVAAVDEGKIPAVASALTKCFNTELARITVNSAMDVHGGRCIVAGPRNYLIDLYTSLPVFITVEGANIMTRNLLIFSQGAMMSHPFLREELNAITAEDFPKFNQLIWQHLKYFAKNLAKTILTTWTQGLLITVPNNKLKREYQQLMQLSYAFAFLADFSLMYLGGMLKRKERLSARLADGMSYLYMAMSALHFATSADDSDDSILHAKWAAKYCFYHAQKSLLDLCGNFPAQIIGKILKFIAFPFGKTMSLPNDKLDGQLADLMMSKNSYRNSLIDELYLSGDKKQSIDRMEYALNLIIQNEDLYKKVGKLNKYTFKELDVFLHDKVANGELTKDDCDSIMQTEKAKYDAILVDEFTFDSIKNKTFVAYQHSESNLWQ